MDAEQLKLYKKFKTDLEFTMALLNDEIRASKHTITGMFVVNQLSQLYSSVCDIINTNDKK